VNPIAAAVAADLIAGALRSTDRVHSDAEGSQQQALFVLMGSAVGHILDHLDSVVPRSGDMDIALNTVQNRVQGEDVTTHPTGVLTIPAGQSARIVFVPREGYVAHITDALIRNLDPTGSMSLVGVDVKVQGVTMQRIPEQHYVRPVIMDRDSRLVLTVTNGSGAEVKVSYALRGWLRAQGRPTRGGLKGVGC